MWPACLVFASIAAHAHAQEAPVAEQRGVDAALLAAAFAGDLGRAAAALEQGADVNVQTEQLFTALMFASEKGPLALVELLLEHHPELNVRNSFGGTALYMAVESKHLEIVRSLLAAGASADLAQKEGWTPLIKATANGSVDLVDLLLSYRADPNAGNEFGATALYIAVEKGRTEIAQRLIAAGADINLPQEDGWTPLILAASKGSMALTRVLLSCRPDLDVRNNAGATALYLAVENQQSAIVAALIEAGADVNLAQPDGMSPLMRATADKSLEIVKLLLRAGADQTARNRVGLCAADYAYGSDSKALQSMFPAPPDKKHKAGASRRDHGPTGNAYAEVYRKHHFGGGAWFGFARLKNDNRYGRVMGDACDSVNCLDQDLTRYATVAHPAVYWSTDNFRTGGLDVARSLHRDILRVGVTYTATSITTGNGDISLTESAKQIVPYVSVGMPFASTLWVKRNALGDATGFLFRWVNGRDDQYFSLEFISRFQAGVMINRAQTSMQDTGPLKGVLETQYADFFAPRWTAGYYFSVDVGEVMYKPRRLPVAVEFTFRPGIGRVGDYTVGFGYLRAGLAL